MMSCKQVTKMVAGGALDEAGWWLRMKIRLHHMMCRHCARYARQLRWMGIRVRERYGREVDPTDINDLQQEILVAIDEAEGGRDLS